MKITIPPSDLQRNRPLNPDWYGATFKRMETRQSNDKKSTNFVAIIQLELDDREMEALWNSKALNMMEKFITIVTEQETKTDPVTGKLIQLDFEPEPYYGKKLKVKIDNDAFEGRLISKIKDFLPYNADTTVPFGV